MRWTEEEYQRFVAEQRALRARIAARPADSEARLAEQRALRAHIAAQPADSEARFMWRVIRLAEAHGWTYFHGHRSDKSPAGFPDLVLVRDTVLWIECKTNTGKLTREQQTWLSLLAHAGQETVCWRPSDWEEIEARLGRKAGLS